MDHGWPDWKELEVPDDLDGFSTLREYLCERRDLHIPTWSERYMPERIHWELLKLPEAEIKARQLAKLQSQIAYHERELERCRNELKTYATG